MYVSQVLAAIADGFYTEPSQLETSLSPGLESYYQQHLQKMLDSTDEDFALAILKVLAEKTQPISVADIANFLDCDEFDVEEILESWFEFLQVETITDVTVYRLYHHNFRQCLISSNL
ncbi:hypothetical protein [Anabaena sphaerica]|uniref:hypothetical protein n=1 Tax=Anabaena sphaerica TaxID=212446 RepID=UPI001F5551C4|nr:hypothetical protein [Anabaena sphaerica]